TGRSPSRAENPAAVIHRVCYETPRPIRDINPDVPGWLCAIIDRLLAKKPAERIQTAAELAMLLERGAASAERGTLDVPKPSLRSSRSAFRVPNSALLVAAGLLLAATGVWVIIKNQHGQETARIQVPDGSSVTVVPGANLPPAGQPSRPTAN